MGNSFDRVQWKLNEEFNFRRAELVFQLELENKTQDNFPELYNHYLHVLAAKESNLLIKDAESFDKEWEGKIQVMTHLFTKEVHEMEKRLKHELKNHVYKELREISKHLKTHRLS